LNNLYDYFKKIIEEDKLVQSFIIGNTKFDDIKDELFKVFKSFFFKNNLNLEENPDLFILKPNNGIVSKDDIKNLINNINTTSQFNNIKIYVIDESEKLNDYAYNAILKTLEEPAPNVYAFLITKNIDSVKSTILSRCQKIFISSEAKEEEYDEEIEVLGNEIIDLLEKNPISIISNHFDIYNKIRDRVIFKNILMYLEKKYVQDLNNKIYNNSIIDLDIELLSKKILVINNNINISDYYLNKNLFIDKFLIEMWRCNNENS
jgi:DNA polymerase-3 subunit delta'